ncbi:hypothetical protein [uncultured Maribacter sp.]|uniref:hypothetical protein n=1 Tax=uncultured Maribacter sp. TaxID=431308 RepID=UPI0030ECE848|tara:strand:- start:1108 stop:1323 length:216 start_codon:yes stop_codon:yes gene_type:complete
MKNLLISIFLGALFNSILGNFMTIPEGGTGVIITLIFAAFSYIFLSLYKNGKRKKKTFLQDKLDKKTNKTE